MAGMGLEVLARIKTVPDMTAAFRNEGRCRRLLEQMVWPRGRSYSKNTATHTYDFTLVVACFVSMGSFCEPLRN
jgi:hypothetical protein